MVSGQNNIIILCGVHPIKASARFVNDLCLQLNESNHKCVIITKPYIRAKNNHIISYSSLIDKILNKLKSKLISQNVKKNDYYMFSLNDFNKKSNIKKLIKLFPYKPNIIINIYSQNFINEKELYEIKDKTEAKIYNYMVDMAQMTGGCHFSWDCLGYTNSCDNCPGVEKNNLMNIPKRNLLLKKTYVEKSEIIPVVASEWQMKRIKNSSIYNQKKIYKLHIPTSEKIFSPLNKYKCKKHFNINDNSKVIFVGAVNPTEKRKGFKELVNILEKLNSLKFIEKEIFVLIAGYNRLIDLQYININIINLGYLNYQELCKAYNASDLFLCTSIEDAGPSMINQSLLCGTPVISNNIGVSEDLIKDEEMGYIVDINNPIESINKIKLILSINENDHMKRKLSISKKAFELTSVKKTTEKLIEILNDNN